VEACRNLGLDAQVTGRNDVTIDGRKFSGNAFYDSKGQAYHHGTLLVDVDMTMLGKYLMPSKAKLQSKGVDSVRSRVVNLRALCPALTIDRMKEEMLAAFQKVYGLESEALNADRFDGNYVNRLWERNASWDWNYGKSLPASFVCEDRFPWGGIQLQLQVERGYVKTIQVYSDAMEWNIAGALRETLENCAFTQQTLLEAIQAAQLPQNIQQDLCRLIETQNL
jgi:lipoate-protein ligase A